MRIGIEGKVLTRNIGGIGRCAINLVRALLTLSPEQHPEMEFVIFTAPQTDRSLLDGIPARVCDRFRGVKSTLLRSSLLLPAGLLAERIDVFHGLDQAGIPFFFKRGKYVITLHDVIALALPASFPRQVRLVSSVAFSCVRRQADVVIVPSEATKDDVIRHLKVDRERIVIIPWGCEPRFQPIRDPEHFEELREGYGIPDRYVLFVGTLELRKNVTTLLRAFALTLREKAGQGLKLVIAGGRGWGYESLGAAVAALGLNGHVIFPGFVEETYLPDLYRGARLFVYPSLYEGFGLPILEAMACGVPVIASATSSMPEVAGDAAVLVDPHDPEALAAAMVSVLTDDKLREQLQQKGSGRARCFSWEVTARRTLEVYAALVGR